MKSRGRAAERVPRAKHVVAVRAWWQARVEWRDCVVPLHHRLDQRELCDRANINIYAGWKCHYTTIFLLTPHVTTTH
jgi:hypothetical protein